MADGYSATPTVGAGPDNGAIVRPADAGMVDVITGHASDAGHAARDAGQAVAASAVEQAQTVADEATVQVKDLLEQALGELSLQAGTQQKRLVDRIRGLGDELSSMAQQSTETGIATDLAQQAAGRTHDVASWLDEREPAHVVEELRSFARRRPGAFLAAALGAGLLAGRLTRGVKDASDEQPAHDGAGQGRPASTPLDSITLPDVGLSPRTTNSGSDAMTPGGAQYTSGDRGVAVSEGR